MLEAAYSTAVSGIGNSIVLSVFSHFWPKKWLKDIGLATPDYDSTWGKSVYMRHVLCTCVGMCRTQVFAIVCVHMLFCTYGR